MKVIFPKTEPIPELKAQRKLLTDSITLISLGISIFLLNSWESIFVKASVGLFWVVFFLLLKGPEVVRTFKGLTKNNGNRRASYELSSQR